MIEPPEDPITLIVFLPFYILVLPLIVLGQVSQGRPAPPSRYKLELPTLSSLSPTITRNVEVWEWTDYRNRPRKLVVHREAGS